VSPARRASGVVRSRAVLGDLAQDLRLVVGRLSRRVRQHAVGGLTASQISALSSVDKHGPLRLGELARREAVAAPTLTRIVTGLEDLGLVARSTDPSDARSAIVRVTKAGAARLQQVRAERTTFFAERLARLSDEDLAKVTAVVPVLFRLLEDDS
jgi:DNA-binding MarR family transcriptional regulator